MDAVTAAAEFANQLQQVMTDHGHSACRYNDQARYDFSRATVICGCEREFPGVHLDQPQDVPAEPEPDLMPSEPAEPGTELVTIGKDPVYPNLATLDPTLAYTPVDLEMRVLDVLARLEHGAVFERQAIDNAAAADMAWQRAYWIAYEASEKPSADRRQAEAMLLTEDLHQAKLETERVSKGAKAAMHNLRSVLSGYQSVTRSVGLDYQAGGAQR